MCIHWLDIHITILITVLVCLLDEKLFLVLVNQVFCKLMLNDTEILLQAKVLEDRSRNMLAVVTVQMTVLLPS